MSTNTIWRRMSPRKIMEGVFAVHKPTGISSAQALRDLQHHFNPSELFAPWLDAERAARGRESHNQRNRRAEKRVQVKIGHGGTLDPLATGVLIAGVGKGTKSLQDFLLCTKVYETVVLFGTDTDTYDRVGKVLKRAPYDHVTKEMVEEALDRFRGKFMQLPPLFSALKMNGKPLYEYAREGKEIPREIERREVDVLNLELVEWMEGGTHSHVAPTDEAGHAEINVAAKLWKQENVQPGLKGKRSRTVNTQDDVPGTDAEQTSASKKEVLDKQASEPQDLQEPTSIEGTEGKIVGVNEEGVEEGRASTLRDDGETVPKKWAVQSPAAKPTTLTTETGEEATAREDFKQKKHKLSEDQDDLILERPPTKSRKAAPASSAETAMMSGGLPSPTEDGAPEPSNETSHVQELEQKEPEIKEVKETSSKGPPAVRLRMTVTSGFYVRSLCHDLGAAVGSAALMAELERTRQGEFELGKNVLEWEELGKGESVWGPQVEKVLDEWHAKNKPDSKITEARSS